MNTIIAAQIISFVGLSFYLSSQHISDKKNMLKYHMATYFCYMISYFLLHAYTAAFLSILSLTRSFIFRKERKNNTIFLIIITLLLIPIQIVTYDGIYSLFPTITTIVMNYGIWQKNMTVLRFIFFLNAIGWLAYNLKVGAYVQAIGNAFEVLSSTISIIRFDIKKVKTN